MSEREEVRKEEGGTTISDETGRLRGKEGNEP